MVCWVGDDEALTDCGQHLISYTCGRASVHTYVTIRISFYYVQEMEGTLEVFCFEQCTFHIHVGALGTASNYDCHDLMRLRGCIQMKGLEQNRWNSWDVYTVHSISLPTTENYLPAENIDADID
jgi:hypothetical protein